jgi:hypothetical protein
MTEVQLAHSTSLHELPESVDGEREVGVGREAPMIEGLAAMILPELGRVDVARYLSEGGIAPPHLLIERRIGRAAEAGGRYQSEPASGERFRGTVQGTGSMRRHW